MITPTVGRIVWYFSGKPNEFERPAIVTNVFGDRQHMLDVCVFDNKGATPRRAIPLRQPEDGMPTGEHCVWMPYQVKKENGGELTVISTGPMIGLANRLGRVER